MSRAPASSRAETSKARRDAVLRATSDVLDEVGVGALTIRQVAERAGVSPGTIFLYAASKSDLVMQVFGQRISDAWHRLLDELSDEPPLERVEQFYLSCVDMFYADFDNVRAFYREMAAKSAPEHEGVARLLKRLRDALAEAREIGQIRADVDVKVLAVGYEGAYSMVIPLADRGIEQAENKRILAGCLELLRYGVVARVQHGPRS